MTGSVKIGGSIFFVTALQSSNNRKIDLYSKYKALTKTVVSYQQIEVRSYNFTIVFAMNRGINYWVSFSFTHSSSLYTKAKFVKKN